MVGYTKRVKFSDKLRALELLGKNLQMFIDTSRIIHQGKVTLEDLITASITEANKEVVDGKSSVPEITAGEGNSSGAVASITPS
jgi:hypothetical protein